MPLGQIRCGKVAKRAALADMAKEISENWSDEDLDLLLSLASEHLTESLRCHNAGAPRAALTMLGGSLEAVLLGAVIAFPGSDSQYEDALSNAKVPRRPPSDLHLSELAKIAREMGWLDQKVADEWVGAALNGLRTAAAHPGAYVRGKHHSRESDPEYDLQDPAWFGTAFEIVYETCRKIFAELFPGRTEPYAADTEATGPEES